MGVLLVVGGRLGDKFGQRPLFLIGMAGSTLASTVARHALRRGHRARSSTIRGDRMLNRPGRYHRLRHLSTLDPVADCHTIYRTTTLYEFPFEAKIGLLLAFWRTFAIPSIAQLLITTGETTERTARRTDDTGILMYELIDHGLDHPRGRTATRRLNQIHRRYPIGNDDHRYVLGTFIVTATRFVDRYGWRPLSDVERHATYHFYAELGRRMDIHDIPPDLDAYTTFFDDYEAHHLAHTPAAERLMNATRGLLGTMLPRPLAAAGPPLLAALLDEPLRRATATPPPSRAARATLTTALTIRGFLLRHLYPPRRHSSLAAGINATTYPDGYDLATVGPAAPATPPTRTPGTGPRRSNHRAAG